MSVMKRVDDVRSDLDAQLGWLQFLLRRDHEIEKTRDEIWWAIYSDAGRHWQTAVAMVQELGNNDVAFARFAESFKSDRPRVVVVSDGETTKRVDAAWILISLGFFFVGLVIGGVL